MSSYNRQTTLKNLWNVSGKTNILAAFFGLFILIFICIREMDLTAVINSSQDVSGTLATYKTNSIYLWISCYCLFMYALSIPVLRTRRLPYGNEISILFIGLSVVVAIILAIAIPLRLEQPYGEILTTLGPLFAGVFAILILMIQVQNSSLARRSNNSMQALLQMRMSEVQQRHEKKVNDLYPARLNTVIPKEDVDFFHTQKCDESDSSYTKISAIASQVYLLNYFEFLAYGIQSYTLDEELLYGTLGSIVIKNYQRGEEIIKSAQQKDPKSFSSLCALNDKWSLRRKFESKRNGTL